jgi:hypothetical protein
LEKEAASVDTEATREASVDMEHAIKTMETRRTTTPSRTSNLDLLVPTARRGLLEQREAMETDTEGLLEEERREAMEEG